MVLGFMMMFGWLLVVGFQEKVKRPPRSGDRAGVVGVGVRSIHQRKLGCSQNLMTQGSRKLPRACFSLGCGESVLVRRSSPMHDATAIHGYGIIDLVANYPEGIQLSQLMEIVSECYGRSVTFHTCSAMGMDLDDLLAFLEDRDKVRIVAGVVHPGGAPACEH